MRPKQGRSWAPIRIGFRDFSVGFNIEKLRIFDVLRRHFPIELSDRPDYLIYSDYGATHLETSCVKIHFSGENIRPNYRLADFALGFDYSNDERHLRYPLYVEYRDQTYNEGYLERPLDEADVDRIMARKSKFCCFVVSNGKCGFRNSFFEMLNRRRRVDSGGAFMNNIGGRVENKIEFMKDYKFIIAFENVAYPGYTTEKVLQPFYSRTVPIYWGNPKVSDEFDPSSFVWVKDERDAESAIERVLALSEDEGAYRDILKRTPFYERRRNLYYSEDRLVVFFDRVFSKQRTDVSDLARQSARRHAQMTLLGMRVMNRLMRSVGL